MSGTVAQSHLSPPATFHYTGRVGIVRVVASISFPWEITIPLLRFHFRDSIYILCFSDHQIYFLFAFWVVFHKDHVCLLRIQVWDVWCRVDENLVWEDKRKQKHWKWLHYCRKISRNFKGKWILNLVTLTNVFCIIALVYSIQCEKIKNTQY
jgi:hypothetical protein